MNLIEKTLKKSLQKMGLLLRYYTPSASEEARRILLLKHFTIDTVYDLGANVGQYAQEIIEAGFSGKVISVEPLRAAHEQLSKASQGNSNWIIAPRCAVGAEMGSVEIHVSKNTVSSSILPVLPAHTDGAPDSITVGKEEVPLFTLDHLISLYPGGKKVFVKIDVQGYEQEVLKGASNSLAQLSGLEIEMSVKPLYADQQWMFEDILLYMREHGFALKSLAPAFTHPQKGEVLQYNGIFFRDHA